MKQVHNFRATTNASTIQQWKDNGIEVQQIKNETTGKITFARPNVEIDVDVVSLEDLANSETGKKALNKMLNTLAISIMRPFVESSAPEEDYPDLTDPEVIFAALKDPVKTVKLTATKEEMETAADAFNQFLQGIGKTGNAAVIQVNLFKSKFSTSKLDAFVQQIMLKNVELADALGYVTKMQENLLAFSAMADKQDEEVRAALVTPIAICIQSVNAWFESANESEVEDTLDLDAF